MGIGRGRSICEYDEIMQIPPGSSDDALLINASRAFCNVAVRANAAFRTLGLVWSNFGLR